MDVRVKWIEERSFVGACDTGHKIAFGAVGSDGLKPGPSPMELILMGTGGCSVYDVVAILEKGRQAVENVEVELHADRAETDPKIFTRIHMHFIVKGRQLDEKRVSRAVELSIEKYCSASAMMQKSAELTHDFEIIDTSES
ncbi:MAG: osmotically inducible protein C [Ponticaulis sp.]|nr:osmotically inducible protein C [Ponticaulis sp.]|tara:strand:+ start:63761 stop:64183 length:423 start_codon:yes stop_codon:yes gene_type:complete